MGARGVVARVRGTHECGAMGARGALARVRGSRLRVSVVLLLFEVVLVCVLSARAFSERIAVLGFLTGPAGPARIEGGGSHSYTISFS